jgi:hypothetical protein
MRQTANDFSTSQIKQGVPCKPPTQLQRFTARKSTGTTVASSFNPESSKQSNVPSKFSFGSDKSHNSSLQASMAKLGFPPFSKTQLPEEVKEERESPES